MRNIKRRGIKRKFVRDAKVNADERDGRKLTELSRECFGRKERV